VSGDLFERGLTVAGTGEAFGRHFEEMLLDDFPARHRRGLTFLAGPGSRFLFGGTPPCFSCLACRSQNYTRETPKESQKYTSPLEGITPGVTIDQHTWQVVEGFLPAEILHLVRAQGEMSGPAAKP
jgi:hypothetical protein